MKRLPSLVVAMLVVLWASTVGHHGRIPDAHHPRSFQHDNDKICLTVNAEQINATF